MYLYTNEHKPISKLQIEQTVFFVISHVPNVDSTTLDKFLALINAEKRHVSWGYKELIYKVQLVLKYVPDACPYSLKVLLDLLEAKESKPKKNVTLTKMALAI